MPEILMTQDCISYNTKSMLVYITGNYVRMYSKRFLLTCILSIVQQLRSQFS